MPETIKQLLKREEGWAEIAHRVGAADEDNRESLHACPLNEELERIAKAASDAMNEYDK